MRRRNPPPKRRRPLKLDSGTPVIQMLMRQIAEQPVTDDAEELKRMARLLSSVAQMTKLEAQFGPCRRPPRTRRNP